MTLALKYNLPSLLGRWRSTLTAVSGIALTVAVFVLVMALADGLRATYLNTGDSRNLLVLRKGALAESSSQITLDEVRHTKDLEGIARDAKGEPLASAEVIVLVTMDRNEAGKAQVQVRGLGPTGGQLRPRIHLVEGRWLRPGLRECVVSRSVARRFHNCALGQTLRSGNLAWKVVGLFDARKTAYDSEIWVDADEAREAFNRSFYCSMLIQPVDEAAAASLIERIGSDRRMRLRALTETEYYAEQTKIAKPIRWVGACLALIMGLGAGFSAMNTMYAAVGARAREIGTLHMLGFSRGSICLAFMLESLAVALLGGALGCLLSLPLQGLATGMFNWKTFAEVAFEFRITGGVLAGGLAFAAAIGLLGGFLPARRAARQPGLDSLPAI